MEVPACTNAYYFSALRSHLDFYCKRMDEVISEGLKLLALLTIILEDGHESNIVATKANIHELDRMTATVIDGGVSFHSTLLNPGRKHLEMRLLEHISKTKDFFSGSCMPIVNNLTTSRLNKKRQSIHSLYTCFLRGLKTLWTIRQAF